ncbi:MAG: sulfatase-like hydrolase/transferase [Smithellaceae bacterium]
MKNLLIRSLPPRPVAWLFLVWLAQSALFPGYLFYQYGGGSRLAFLMHLVLVFSLLIVCLTPFTLKAAQSIALPVRRAILALVMGSLQGLLLAFYALTILGYQSWSGPFTMELLRVYAGQLSVLLNLYGLSSAWTIIVAVTAWFLIVVAYYNFSRSVLLSLDARAATAKADHSLWRGWAWCAVALLMIVYGATRPAWVYKEPLHAAWMNGHGFLRQAPQGLFMKKSQNPLETTSLNASDVSKVKPRLLVLIIVDSLCSDLMGVYGAPEDNTPFLSELYRRGKLRRFENAYSVCTTSFCGIIGTLSARYWHQLHEPPVNIADILKRYGYHIRFLLSGDHENFFGIRRVFGDHIDLYRDGSFAAENYANDDHLILQWMEELDWQSNRAVFLYAHLMSVHAIGLRDPRFKNWQPDKEWNYLQLTRTPRSYRNNYHNGILQADSTIERIFQILAGQGVLDNALVVITADHGEHLGEGGRFGHGGKPLEPVVRIPVLIYDGQTANYPERAVVSQVDIAPTFLHAIGAPFPADWSGIPLQLPATRNAVYVASYESAGVVADIAGRRYKYLQNRKNGDEELFDLTAPDAESLNLTSKPGKAGVLASLRELRVAAGRSN